MPLPAEMTAIEITKPGEPDVLRPAKRPLPRFGDDEVLIEVAAAGVNRPDVLQRRGLYEPPPGTTDIPGLEAAGTIVAVGPGVTRWKAGDRVCALVAGVPNRLELIVRFLAVLELYKQGVVDMLQFTNFGELMVRRLHADEVALDTTSLDDWEEVRA